MASTWRIALRNLGRNPKRGAIAVTAIAVAQLALLFTNAMLRGYGDAMVDAVTGPFLGHVQVHAPQYREDRAMDLTLSELDQKLQAIARVPGVTQASARIYGPVLAALGEQGHVGIAIGVEPRLEAQTAGLLSSLPEAQLPEGHEIVLGRALAQTMGAHPGDEIAVVGQAVDGSIADDLYRVRALMTSSVGEVQQSGIVMSLDAAQALFAMPDQAHEISVHSDDAQRAPALARRLAALPALAGLEVLPWQRLAPELLSLLKLIDVSGWVVLALVFLAAAAGVANTMLMATFERSHEIGMLLALGTTPLRLVAMILLEALLLGLIGVGIGTALAAAVIAWATHSGVDLTTFGNQAARELSFQGLNYHFEIIPRIVAGDLVKGVIGIVVTSLAASLWPAWHVARMSPVEAMRA